MRALFMFFDPWRGWRDHRPRRDWAEEVRRLLDEDYPGARKVRLLCDHLNTHHLASLYEAFPAPEAHRLARRLEIVHSPRNGSWRNIAEIALSEQCLNRRLPDDETLTRAISAWPQARNDEGGKVMWRFATADARIKLRRLYPQTVIG